MARKYCFWLICLSFMTVNALFLVKLEAIIMTPNSLMIQSTQALDHDPTSNP